MPTNDPDPNEQPSPPRSFAARLGAMLGLRAAPPAGGGLARAAAADIRFREGLDALGEGFALYDAQDRIVTWNTLYVVYFPEARSRIRAGMTFAEVLAAVADDPVWAGRPDERERFLAASRAGRAATEAPFILELPGPKIVEGIERPTAGASSSCATSRPSARRCGHSRSATSGSATASRP